MAPVIPEIHKLPSELDQLLFSYQRNHAVRLINILRKNNSVLDASDTGTGKTYSAMAVAAYLKLQPIIICPKSIVSNWSQIAAIFGVEPLIVTNYESIRIGSCFLNGRRVKSCPFVDVQLKEKKKPYKIEWKLDGLKTMFIFDEAHRCRHFGTMNSQMLLAAKETGHPLMMLTATVADSPENFKIFTYLLNFIDPQQVSDSKIDRREYFQIMDRWLLRDNKPMVKIHGFLYPDRASRIRIDDLGSLFPETQITANAYNLDEKRTKEIQMGYQQIATQLDSLGDKEKKDKKNPLVLVLRAHQKIELLKVPIFVELANDLLVNNYSVVIFVNYTATLKTLCKMLHTDSVIYGQQTAKERQKNIKDFQKNKNRIIICNIMAGGVGISLHDLNGKFPRASLISPTWSSTHLTQALGRIHRAGGKSKSLQRIIYTSNTVEENIAEKLRHKLGDLNSINNGDLDLTNIQFIRETGRFLKMF